MTVIITTDKALYTENNNYCIRKVNIVYLSGHLVWLKEIQANRIMNSKEHVISNCDTVSTTTPETQGNLIICIPTLKQETECIKEEESLCSDYMYLSEPLKSLEYVNYYDSGSYVLETVKKELYEHELLQRDSNSNSNIVSKSEILLNPIDKQEVKCENTEQGLSLEIKKENDNINHEFPIKTDRQEDPGILDCTGNIGICYNTLNIKKEGGNIEYEITVKSERLEEQSLDYTKDISVHYDIQQIPQEVQCKLCDKTFKNRMDNKAAEHSRLYRERHKEEINQRRRDKRRKTQLNQTLSNIQNIKETEQLTQETSNNRLLKSKSHTQRQQRYYERHREEINKRRRDSRLQQKNQTIPATAAERSRKYRERNRQRINEQRKYSRMRQQNVQGMYTEAI